MIKKYAYLYSLLCIFLCWHLFYLVMHVPFIPSPWTTVIYGLNHLPAILLHLSASFLRILTAILFTVLLGSMIGILIARSQKADRWLSPILYTLYPVPKIAFLPLLMLFFGLGNTSKIVLVSMILFFQITLSVRDSVKGIHPMYYVAIRSLGAKKTQIYRHVILPAILPNLFTALRISVGTSISVLFFAENFATHLGIGYFIMDCWLRLDYVAMFSGIVAIGLMGSGLFALLDLAEKSFCKWRQIGNV